MGSGLGEAEVGNTRSRVELLGMGITCIAPPPVNLGVMAADMSLHLRMLLPATTASPARFA
jgi:hypothetical protein